jgi:hypothetical protein
MNLGERDTKRDDRQADEGTAERERRDSERRENAARYRESVDQVNRSRDREIERALAPQGR